MNDDLDPRDELASAYLDGALSAEEAAAVEADDDLLARVAAMRAVAAALRSLPPVDHDDSAREQAIAAALAATAGPVDGRTGSDGRTSPAPVPADAGDGKLRTARADAGDGIPGTDAPATRSHRGAPAGDAPADLDGSGATTGAGAPGTTIGAVGTSGQEAGDGVVVPLARRGWPGSLDLRWVAGVAAVLALVALAVPLLDRGGDGRETAAESAGAAADSASGGSAAGGAAREEALDATAAAPEGSTGEASSNDDGAAALGTFADADDLLDAVGAVPPDAATGAGGVASEDGEALTSTAAAACAARVGSGWTLLGRADLDGVAVEVHLSTGTSARQVLVLDALTCATVARRTL
ncbi:MAG: hypothetical protein AB7L84_00315 [Acidimicrobiia bacterium]